MPATQPAHSEATEKKFKQARLTGVLQSKGLEQHFRRNRLQDDLTTSEVILGVTIAGVLLFVVNDYRLFGATMPFPLLLGVRLGICALSIGVWIKLRSTVRARNPQGFDRALLFWGVILAMGQIIVGFSRPAHYTGHFLVHLFTVLLTYCVVPLPLLKQAVPALLMSIGMIGCMALKPPADGITSSALIWTLIAGNVLGVSISRQMHLSRRIQFVALRCEMQARMGLEEALAELRTLRGIIPICSYCKDIRDDAGSWHQLEAYISNHSDAEFSHGICPPCANKHFRDEMIN